MWRIARGQSRVHGILITTAIVCLSFITVSPSLVAAARGAHSRMRAMVSKKARPVVRQPAAGVPNPDQEILIRLENGQQTLEKQTADLKAAVQRQMSQLGSAIEDSRKETQQMLRQTGKIDSTLRLLRVIVALLVLLCGGLLYIGQQLQSRPNKGFVWKGDLPDVPEQSHEEGIVGLRIRPKTSVIQLSKD